MAELRAAPGRRARAPLRRRRRGPRPEDRPEALADALSADGYAASVVESNDRRRGADLPAPLPGRPRRRRVPRAVRGRDARRSPPARHPRHPPRHARPRRRRLHHARATRRASQTDAPIHHPRHAQEASSMTTEAHPELEGHRPVRLRLGRLGRRRRQRAARPLRGRRPRHLREEERARVDARACASRRCACSTRSRCRTGAPTSRASTSTTSSTSCARREKQAATWDDLPEDIKNTYDRSASRRPRSSAWSSGVAAQYESEVVYH